MKNKGLDGRIIMAVISLTILWGCNPVYKTNYSYEPPKDGNASCTYQCENVRMQCTQNQQLQQMQCENNKRQEERYQHDLCLQRNRDKDKGDQENCSIRSRSRTVCTVDEKRCEVPYNSCYVSCGGKVTATEVCVRNCDKAN